MQDFSSILRVIATVHATAGEIDDHIRAIDLSLPLTPMLAVPLNNAPRSSLRPTAQHDHVVVVAVKRAREDRPDLPRAAGNDDRHASSPSRVTMLY